VDFRASWLVHLDPCLSQDLVTCDPVPHMWALGASDWSISIHVCCRIRSTRGAVHAVCNSWLVDLDPDLLQDPVPRVRVCVCSVLSAKSSIYQVRTRGFLRLFRRGKTRLLAIFGIQQLDNDEEAAGYRRLWVYDGTPRHGGSLCYSSTSMDLLKLRWDARVDAAAVVRESPLVAVCSPFPLPPLCQCSDVWSLFNVRRYDVLMADCSMWMSAAAFIKDSKRV